mmetsp:Transcript_42969/g.96725  ORF Transcript_42969/g.96725 Transcript_42969/m.96725 type:complete len:222 (+) Transcript_42969:1557-2222(+)
MALTTGRCTEPEVAVVSASAVSATFFSNASWYRLFSSCKSLQYCSCCFLAYSRASLSCCARSSACFALASASSSLRRASFSWSAATLILSRISSLSLTASACSCTCSRYLFCHFCSNCSRSWASPCALSSAARIFSSLPSCTAVCSAIWLAWVRIVSSSSALVLRRASNSVVASPRRVVAALTSLDAAVAWSPFSFRLCWTVLIISSCFFTVSCSVPILFL